MAKIDSFDKIVESYFTVLSRSDFRRDEIWTESRPVLISPKILRADVCVPNCGACCRAYTQDWLPSEKHPSYAVCRTVEIDFEERKIFTTWPQKGAFWCRHLDLTTGKCKIYNQRPLTCEFELLRASVTEAGQNELTTRLYGRGWALTRVDKKKGALCKIEPATQESAQNTIRRLLRLQKWLNYFELDSSRIDDIIRWINASPIGQHRSLFLNP